MYMKNALLLLGLISLSGCAMSWGGPYKIEHTNPSSITISYDPSLTNMGEVQNIAQQHCDQYNKDALPGKDMKSPWGYITLSFRCNKRATL